MKTTILSQQIGSGIQKMIFLVTLLFSFQLSVLANENPNAENPKHKKTIILITGAFVTNEGWDGWKSYYESKGYNVITPAWPHKKGLPEFLKTIQPDSLIANLNLKEIVDYHARIIDSLPEKPILVGHSFGGLIVQLLLQQDKAAVGVAYHSVPPQGVFSTKFSFLRSLWGPLGLFKSNKKTFVMSYTQWQYAFTNGMPESEQKAYYDKLVIPESRNVLWGALKKSGKVDFRKAHAPLLFVSGTTDNIIPASLNKKTYKKYKKHAANGSVTEYKEFEGRNHLAMSQPNWKEDADFILDWIEKNDKSIANGYTIKGLPEGMESMILPIMLQKLPTQKRFTIDSEKEEKRGIRLKVTFYDADNTPIKSNFLIAKDGKFLELNLLEDAKISTTAK